MRVLIINEVCGTGSTGKICASLAEQFLIQGDEVKVAYGRLNDIPENCIKYSVRIGNSIDVYWHALYTRLTDRHGFASVKATQKFIEWAQAYNPDLVWLHNIHGYYVNIELLFKWIKSRPDMQVKWTLHDCWTFTGHCSNFLAAGCTKWAEGCEHCPQKNMYPASLLLDNSKSNYLKKKEIFCGIKNMTIITPSNWLAGLVNQSFLNEYKTEVQHNYVDKGIFKPTQSDFRKRYDIIKSKMVLAVSNAWHNPNKGLKDIYRLAEMLDDSYVIVIVGLSEKMIADMPKYTDNPYGYQLENSKEEISEAFRTSKGVAISASPIALYKAVVDYFGESTDSKGARLIGINKTNDVYELAAIYSSADVFINPTYEDNYPTVNLEASACGTWVITYDTGGCRETLGEEE